MTPDQSSIWSNYDNMSDVRTSVPSLNSNPMPCPRCLTDDVDYVHPVGVTVNAGGTWTNITHQGVTWGFGPTFGRGVYIELRFHCEAGHMWRQWWQFHKGGTWSGTEDIHDCSDGIASDGMGPYCWPETIWRD